MAGYLAFATGQVLTAAQVNGFLMEQATMTFANDAARTTALASVLREGLLTYNLDTNRLEVYDGTAWVEPAPEPPAGIGSNVVSVTKTDVFTTTSTSFVTVTGLSATITPSSATSKILIIAQVSYGSVAYPRFAFSGGNTAGYIGNAASSRSRGITGGDQTGDSIRTASLVFLDSPATAAAVTYNVRMSMGVTGTGHVNRSHTDFNNADGIRGASSITAIEVSP